MGGTPVLPAGGEDEEGIGLAKISKSDHLSEAMWGTCPQGSW